MPVISCAASASRARQVRSAHKRRSHGLGQRALDGRPVGAPGFVSRLRRRRQARRPERLRGGLRQPLQRRTVDGRAAEPHALDIDRRVLQPPQQLQRGVPRFGPDWNPQAAASKDRRAEPGKISELLRLRELLAHARRAGAPLLDHGDGALQQHLRRLIVLELDALPGAVGVQLHVRPQRAQSFGRVQHDLPVAQHVAAVFPQKRQPVDRHVQPLR